MKWQILRIRLGDEEYIFKLMRGFYGGYLDGDSWSLNSGITKIECDIFEGENTYVIYGNSGSVYRVHVEAEGLTSYMCTMINYWREQFPAHEFALSNPKEYWEYEK